MSNSQMGFLAVVIALGIFFLYIQRIRKKEPTLSITTADLEPFLKNLDLEKENKVRSQWRISFFTWILTVNILYAAATFLQNPVFDSAIIFISSVILQAPLHFFIYHRAYRKRGRALLFLISFIFGLNIIVLTIASLFALPLSLLILIPLSVPAFFCINSFRLYKVNSARNYQKILAFKHKYGPDADGFCAT